MIASMALPPFDRECFFAAPIGDEGTEGRRRSDQVRDYIVTPAVVALGLEVVRADAIAEPGSVTSQVLEHVIHAKAVVADLTDNNPNVYYELAIRHCAHKPVVLISETALPFDLVSERTIFFSSSDLSRVDNCKRKIVDHFTSAFRGDSQDSPVQRTVDLNSLRAGNTMERQVARLATTVDELTHTVISGSLGNEALRPLGDAVMALYPFVEDENSPLGRAVGNLVNELTRFAPNTNLVQYGVGAFWGDYLQRLPSKDEEARLLQESQRHAAQADE